MLTCSDRLAPSSFWDNTDRDKRHRVTTQPHALVQKSSFRSLLFLTGTIYLANRL
jgi:hypothetical protein